MQGMNGNPADFLKKIMPPDLEHAELELAFRCMPEGIEPGFVVRFVDEIAQGFLVAGDHFVKRVG